MNSRRIFLKGGLYASAVVIAIVWLLSTLAFSPKNAPVSSLLSDDQANKYESLLKVANSAVVFDAKKQKLDGFARMVLNAPNRQRGVDLCEKLNLFADFDASGRLLVDVFIQLNDHSVLSTVSALGIQIRTQVGDILVARAPVEALTALAEEPGIRRVEMSQEREAKLDSSGVNIGADRVHLGVDLSQAYQGEDVVVGVIDSGIDFTHPDFSDVNGSRIQYLLEFIEGGGQNEWTKSDLDDNPSAVTQKDGDGGGGHGTHVTGIAAGGGRLNSALRGVAPAADIIFVKGLREQNSYGTYNDSDVVAGCQYIFDKADQMGKPAVINLSIGSHGGPHDGTSLYEQALSGLVGPGRIIVAAAGNEGNKLIHAGGQATAGVLNETFFIADSLNQRAIISMWYDTDVISAVSIFAYDSQFNFLGQLAPIPVGLSTLEPTPFVINNDTLGFVSVDAVTTHDPNNGDGNALFMIENNGSPTIDISDVIWAVASQGSVEGRIDLWVATGGHFYEQVVGFPNETEMPGNNDYSVGIPATAEKVISVGSYTTKTSWFDVDGDSLWLASLPEIGDRAASSSKGPTRDERISPDITAPGQFVFSALSSQLTEGVGYSGIFVLQGGGFLGKGGTSQASPHVAGTLALMLQVKNDLTYEEAVEIFTETARTNQFIGTTPNDDVGLGYLDAYASVKKLAAVVSSVAHTDAALPELFMLKPNYPNPFNPATNIEYSLTRDARAVLIIYNVVGQQIKMLVNETQKAGAYTIQWNGTNETGQHVGSGVYYARFQAGQFAQTRKMVLLR